MLRARTIAQASSRAGGRRSRSSAGTPCDLDGRKGFYLCERRRTDTGDVVKLLDRLEGTVEAAVFEDRLSGRRTYAGKLLQALGVGRVDVDEQRLLGVGLGLIEGEAVDHARRVLRDARRVEGATQKNGNYQATDY